MRIAHALNQIILFSMWSVPRYSGGARAATRAVRHHTMSPERVISISISEADWKTLRSIQPEPLDWLKDTIRQTVEQARQTAPRESDTPAAPIKIMSAGRKRRRPASSPLLCSRLPLGVSDRRRLAAARLRAILCVICGEAAM
jgi:nucleotidyltransferase/DNA polymerase involved in DNA repair